MYFKFKPKRVPRLGDSLKNTVERKFLWKAIDAGRVGEIFKQLAENTKELAGSQMVSWSNPAPSGAGRGGIIKIKVSSPAQRQEIFLKQEEIKEAMRKKKIEVKEIKVVF